MNNDKKMWYSIPEVLVCLQIEESALLRKMNFLNFDPPQRLVGLPGLYISHETVQELQAMLAPTPNEK